MAKVVTRSSRSALFLQSKMWWVTVLCLLMAVWLAWASLPETGPEITIHFPEGHGLKTGDAVRYRGIDVGTVTSVALNETLSGVDVVVMLSPKGGRLNREGTRFWIVRPQLSVTKVTGLETALGAKYIGVSPGDPAGGHRDIFDGLPVPPPDELTAGGLELVLRSTDRHGLNIGSPVTWRGVDVGQVLAVGLSPDARHVNTTIRINRSYRRLVRTGSRFWMTSGFGVDVSLTGLKVSAQSLTTIARGGISFVTVSTEGNDSVRDGHMFPLARQAKEEWLTKASHVPLIEFSLPTTVTVQYNRNTSLLGIPRTRSVTQNGIFVSQADGQSLMTASLNREEGDAAEQVVRFQITEAGEQESTTYTVPWTSVSKSATGIFRAEIDPAESYQNAAPGSFRTPSSPEECLLVRTAGSSSESVPVIQPVDPEQMTDDEGVWKISDISDDISPWHGAPAVAVSDGKIVGLLINSDSGPAIAPYSDNWQPAAEE